MTSGVYAYMAPMPDAVFIPVPSVPAPLPFYPPPTRKIDDALEALRKEIAEVRLTQKKMQEAVDKLLSKGRVKFSK